MRVGVIEYGCAVTHIFVPDKTGGLRDVVLGYENLAGYEAGTASLGALVGRYANRIEGAAFELDGRRYELEANDGPNHLHGCFGRKVFPVSYTHLCVGAGAVRTGQHHSGAYARRHAVGL